MNKVKATNKDTLYYDGNCPLCTAEVCKIEKLSQGEITLKNIHELTEDKSHPTKAQLLERLHLQTAEGEWMVGIDANVRAWKNTPYAKIWNLLNLPIIRYFSAAAYEIWLRVRALTQNKT